MIFFAGVASGLVMGLAFLGLGAVMLTHTLGRRTARSKRASGNIKLTYLILPLSFLVVLLWGIVGGLLSIAYTVISLTIPGRGLGSPNIAFTLFILFLSLGAGLVLRLVQRRRRWESLTLVLVFAAIFGWLMPWLAT